MKYLMPLALFFLFFVHNLDLALLPSTRYPKKNLSLKTERTPASFQEFVEGSKKVLQDLENPQIFNSTSCASFVNQLTDYLYHVPADHFIPKTNADFILLKNQGLETVERIFQIRIRLNEKLKEFDSNDQLTKECLLEIREGYQYARFAEEYVLDWLFSKKIIELKNQPILTNNKPSTFVNKKYEKFQIKSGDVLLIRGKSYVSAMIARIGDEEGNFSHLAIIGEDESGKKYVVESLIQQGLIVTPIENWIKQEDARVVIYRQADEVLATAAAKTIYKKALEAIRSGETIRYDFSMDDQDHSKLFCSEVIRYAYKLASNEEYLIPKFRSSVSKFKGSDYPRSLGVTKDTLFAPYDIEVDPRFELVAEYRFFPLLRQVRMQDSVLQSIYSWMTERKYTFQFTPTHSLKALLAKIARQFGFAAESLPKYMPMDTLYTTIQFEAVAKALEENIYKKEEEFYQRYGYLPSFQDMMKIHDDFRLQDCKSQFKVQNLETQSGDFSHSHDSSKFHWFFASQDNRCE